MSTSAGVGRDRSILLSIATGDAALLRLVYMNCSNVSSAVVSSGERFRAVSAGKGLDT